VNKDSRWAYHRSALRHDHHHCEYLQNAWNKYGEKAFKFVILETLKTNDKFSRTKSELKHIANKVCYNSRIAALGLTNFENAPHVRNKIAVGLNLKLKTDADYRNLMSTLGANLAALARTPKSRAKMSVHATRLWKDPLHRKRVSAKLATYWLQPGIKEEHSARVKLVASTLESRKRKSIASKKRSSELSALMSKTNKKRWSDPKAKKIQAAKMHAYHVRRRAALATT
jgi:hypothetical protein